MKTQYRGPMRLAHRGLWSEAPENTLEAMEAAARAGCEGVEIDIRMTADGEIAVLHDETMERITAGSPTGRRTERVDALCWEELAAMELPYANHLAEPWRPAGFLDHHDAINFARQRGEDPAHPHEAARASDGRTAKPLLLRTLLQWNARRDAPLLIEIEYKAPGMMPRLMEELTRSSARDRCVVFSGDPACQDEIFGFAAEQGVPDGVRLGINIRTLDEDWKRRLPALRPFEVGLDPELSCPEDTAWLHGQGFQVFSNLGDYPAGWGAICRICADALKTNYPEPFAAWYAANQ